MQHIFPCWDTEEKVNNAAAAAGVKAQLYEIPQLYKQEQNPFCRRSRLRSNKDNETFLVFDVTFF